MIKIDVMSTLNKMFECNLRMIKIDVHATQEKNDRVQPRFL